MRTLIPALVMSALLLPAIPAVAGAQDVTPTAASADLDVTDARVRYLDDLRLLVFEQQVAGTAGATTPRARGAMDGAPVLGYVFPTSLDP
ncbi:MAG: hypothetical protein ACODAB_05245, partial [Gemmatimonadota bacterium]